MPDAVLRDSLLVKALAGSAIASCLVAPDGSFLWVNDALCGLLGRPADVLVTCSWQELTHPDDLEVDLGLVAEVIDGTREEYRLRKRYLRPDGTVVWGDLTVTGIRDEAGTLTAFVSQIVDVTEDVRDAERYRLISENAADFVTRSSADQVLQWVSPSVTSVLGWTPAEIIGIRFGDLVHPEDRFTTSGPPEEWAASLAEATPPGGFAKRVRCKDGSYRHLTLRTSAIPDVTGGVPEYVGAWRDVEGEVQARQGQARSETAALEALDAELEGRVILEAVRDESGAIVDFEYLQANPVACDGLGLTREQVVGRRMRELFPGAVESGRLAEYAAVVETGVPMVWDARPIGTSRLGEDRYLDARIVKVGDGVSYAFRDVTDRTLAERRLAESERQLRLLTDNTRDAVLMAGADGTITYCSPAVTSILGWAPDDVIGHRTAEFLHPDDLAVLAQASQHVETGRDTVGTGRIRHKDGTYRYIESAIKPILDGDGTLIGRTASWRDVTDRVEADLDRQRVRERLQATLDSQIEPHITMRAIRDQGGVIVDFAFEDPNPAALAFLGMSAEQFLSRTFMDLFPSAAMRDMYARTVETGEPLVEDDYSYANAVFGGETRRFRLRGAKLGDGVAISWEDVTERIAAARRLAESEERYRLLADNSADLIATSDINGRFTYLSPASFRVLGFQPEELVGQSPIDLLNPEDAHIFAESAPRVSAGSRLVRTARFRHRDGHDVWIEASIQPITDSDGVVVGRAIAGRDVSERVEVQTRLTESEELFRLLAENSTDVVALIRDGAIAWVSPSIEDVDGVPPERWIGTHAIDVVHPDDLPVLAEALADVEAGQKRLVRLRLVPPTGATHWVEVNARTFYSADGEPDGLIASLRVIDDLMAAEAELERRANVDFLTGLANRRDILQHLSRATTRVSRTGSEIGILFCDIDHFKDVNDEHGHAAGDEVLRTLGERISATIRADDQAARIGGDEILVVLHGVHSLEDATALAEKIRDVAAQRIGLERGDHVTPTLSIGVTLLRTGETTDQLVERADNAMYLAKKAGRNRVISIE